MANSNLNSYCNAYNLPTNLLNVLGFFDSTGFLFPALRSYGVGFEPKKCYDPSTRTSIQCNVNDWTCLVRKTFK